MMRGLLSCINPFLLDIALMMFYRNTNCCAASSLTTKSHLDWPSSLPHGGATASVFIPHRCTCWLEDNYYEPLLGIVRDMSPGGPIPMMLCPKTEALAVFVESFDEVSLTVADQLARTSGFP